LGERLRGELAGLEDHPKVGDIRNKGLLFGIELVEDKESRQPATPQTMTRIISGCKERGLIVAKNGDTVAGFNNVITLCPSFNIPAADLTFIAGTLREVFGS
jgi:taurine-pyruvate aminotransferase